MSRHTAQEKETTVAVYLHDKKKQKEICSQYGISRYTLYMWVKQYKEEGSFKTKFKRGNAHHKSLQMDTILEVLDATAQNPKFSIGTLHKELVRTGIKVSYYGLQKIWERYHLNHVADRMMYAQKQGSFVKITPKTTAVLPTPTLAQLTPNMLPAPPPAGAFSFSLLTHPRNILLTLLTAAATTLGITYFLLLTESIVTAPSIGQGIGRFFSGMALTFGFFFFLYSFKYYLGIIFVLFFSRKFIAPDRTQKKNEVPTNALLPDISKTELTRTPFVSIHLPLYNEKRVVNRLLEAATSMNYDNFEVIVCDDSTDETKDIVLEWKNHPRVKISHRQSRDGFKGAALQEALKIMDPRTEFVIVFDADFMPFPDSVENFLKYFQSVVGSLSPKDYQHSDVAAIQGYQWHVLNKSENYITRGVRTEYAGSYVIERSSAEIYGGLKQIAGSVFMIRADVLKSFGWGRSITEDFQLTLRLYAAGYKVVYSPYVQAPSECVSTLKRLVRQRMRWAEGHSHNIKKMLGQLLFGKWEKEYPISNFKYQMSNEDQSSNSDIKKSKWVSSRLSLSEKLEALYLAPYYLQSFFFLAGTFCWFLAEGVFQVRLPFWTAVWGWSLVLTNILSLPLMNIVGLFLEEAEEKDYAGIASFLLLTYLVAPFQAYAAVKGFIEKEEGPWFRTPKTGRITDLYRRGTFYSWFAKLLGKGTPSPIVSMQAASKHKYNFFSFDWAPSLPKRKNWIGNMAVLVLVTMSIVATSLYPQISLSGISYASEPMLKTAQSGDASLANPKNPPNKEKIIKNAQSKNITTPRAIAKKTKDGEEVTFIFSQSPKVRIKSGIREIEFETVSIGGKAVSPRSSKIMGESEVRYNDVVAGIDLVYTIGDQLVSEQFIVNDRTAAKLLGDKLEQRVLLTNVKVVQSDSEHFGFFDEENKAVFEVADPFAKDDDGTVFEQIGLTLDPAAVGYIMTKQLGSEFKSWIEDPIRSFPVVVDPSVIVSSSIVNADTAHGNFQRKVNYMANATGGAAWYAFFADPDASYKKCLVSTACDAAGDWTGPVDIDTGDADNINPTIGVSGDMIMIAWVDDSLEKVEIKRLDVTSDTLGTLCTPSQASPGAMDASTIVTIAAMSTTEAVVAFADDAAAGVVDVYDATGLSGSCTTTDVHPGNLPFGTFGAGVTIDDRPIIMPLTSTTAAMVFQDGTDLSMAVFNTTLAEWTQNNTTLGAVTNTVFSATTDGTSVWAVTSNSGTVELFKCCTASTGMNETSGDLETDVGAAGDEQDNNVDIFCPSATTCQITYIDDQDTTTPALKIIGCTNADCSSLATGTPREIDTDVGSATEHDSNPSIFCVTDANNCKIAYGDNMDTTTPDLVVIDCNDADCDTPTAGTPNTDTGETTAPKLWPDMYCVSDTDCKVAYLDNDASSGSLTLVDCSNAQCSTNNSNSNIQTNINNSSGTYMIQTAIWCVATNDCRITYHDRVEGDLEYIDCPTNACSGQTGQDIDTDVGTSTIATVPNEIDCSAGGTDCKIIYVDASAASLYFVDCASAACQTSPTITQIDAAGAGNLMPHEVSLDCVSATDCKGTWAGVVTGGSEQLYFFDCDDATCTSGNAVKLASGAETRGAVYCPATADCKLAYFKANGATPTLEFADCTNESCLPESSALTDPWSGLTNLSSVSITYDSSNSDLYVHAVYGSDAGTEQAYWKSSDASTISWGSESSYGFTAGDIGEISSPMTAAGSTQVAVVVRQGSNFEFAPAPENLFALLGVIPFMPLIFRKLKKRARDNLTKQQC